MLNLKKLATLLDNSLSKETKQSVEHWFAYKQFKPPFRVGRKQKRAVLDADGKEVVVFKPGLEDAAQDYCNYLNNGKSY